MLAGTSAFLAGCGAGPAGPTTDTGNSLANSLRAFPFAQSPILSKFIAPLPRLGAGIPLATADQSRVPGADFYSLAASQFQQVMHPELPKPTTLWGYRDLTSDAQAYLGPVIVARRNRPVILQMQNLLPAVHPLPIDTTLMGANGGAAPNRIAVHLHGGFVPWNSDGGPFSWYTPAGRLGAGDDSAGSCFLNGTAVGTAQYYYPNQQSARLLWYHDHAMGITRLNAYAGLASGYLMTDDVLDRLTAGNAPLVPPLQYTIPLILQEKTFKAQSDPWGNPGDLWYPSMYQPNQYDAKGNLLPGPGRWDLALASNGFSGPGYPPQPSCVPEFFGDTPVINGVAYPYCQVEPRRYRLVVLNGSQARFFSLNLFYESSVVAGEPDLTRDGPAFIQIGNEGGLLPVPAVFAKSGAGNKNSNRRMAFDTSNGPTAGNAVQFNLLLAPAERADLIVDFSNAQPGDRFILYSDAPAPFPGGDDRNDYYSGCPDHTTEGGAPTTSAGKGPNTRTLMQFRVVARQGSVDAYDFAATVNALATQLPQAYSNSHQPFGESDLIDFNADPNSLVLPVQPLLKTLNEDFDGYGRLIQRLGTGNPAQKKYSDSWGLGYDDVPTETASDGETQVWDIYNLTGDTHPIHFHLVNVQVIGRAPFDPASGAFTPVGPFARPDANERGWKETVRMNPAEVTRVIMKFALPSVPFAVPASPRTGGNDYVWHCHILEHEEHDMMRPLVVR